MKEDAFVHSLSIDGGFSEDEIAEAKATLIENQTAFYRRDYIGHKLRECAINIWKDKLVSDGKRSKSELDDETAAMIIADLENDVDIKNAMVMNIEDA